MKKPFFWAFILFAPSLALTDTYIKTHPEDSSQTRDQKSEKNYFDNMRSVPTINAQDKKPMLRPLGLEDPKKKKLEQQINKIQSANPNSTLLIDARTGKVVGVVPLSQQKDSPTRLSRFQTHKKQSGVQPMPPKIQIRPYQMQEETIHLH